MIEPLSEQACYRKHPDLNLNPLYDSCARSGSYSNREGCNFARGSPIMCRYAKNDVWTLYGIVSQVKTCGVESASIFTRFEAISHWMEQFTTVNSGLEPTSGEPRYSCGSLRDGKSYQLDDTAYWQSDVRRKRFQTLRNKLY